MALDLSLINHHHFKRNETFGYLDLRYRKKVSIMSYKYPRVNIQFCAKCKWHNRAVWYLQELMQTFGDEEKGYIAEIALQPVQDMPGLFQIDLLRGEDYTPEIIYKRKFKKSTEKQDEDYYFEGFPDSKLLKTLIRNKLFPEAGLGHIDRYNAVLNSGSCAECQVENNEN